MSNFFDKPELKRNFFEEPAAEPVRPTPVAPPKLTRTWGETAKDLGVGVVQGAANMLGGTAELANTLTGGIIDKGVRKAQGAVDRLVNGGEGDAPGITGAYTETNRQLDLEKTPLLRRKQQELAETEGFIGSAKKVLTDPALASQFAAEQVANIASIAGTARGTLAKGVEKALSKGATKEAAQAAGRKSLERQIIASEAIQEAGPAAMQARQEIASLPDEVWAANPEYQQRVAAGEDAAAVRESMANVAALKAAGIGGAAGALGGRLTAGLEGRIFTRSLDHAPLLSRKGAKELASTIGKEALEETVQEGGNQLGTNVGMQGIDPTRDLMEGVPEAAGTGAALGGLIGGGLHVAGAATSPLLTRGPQNDPPPTLQLAPPDGTPDHGVIRVGPDGTATTETQRAEADARHETTGLTPDVDAARAAHPGAAPNQVPLTRGPAVPFPGAAPGTLADAVNAQPSTGITGPAVDGAVFAEAMQTGESVNEVRARHQQPPVGSLADAVGAITPTPAPASSVDQSAAPQSAQASPQPAADSGQAAGEKTPGAGESQQAAGVQQAGQGSASTQSAPVETLRATAAETLRQKAAGATQTVGETTWTKQADGRWNNGATNMNEASLAHIMATVPGASQASAPETAAQSASAEGGIQTGAVAAAAAEAATSPNNERPEPTDAQKEAGNYKKGHVKIGGLDISIENEAGTSRRPEWPPLKHHYGYFKGTIGKDKDHVDVFLTEHAEDTSRPVFVVDQFNGGKFDEHKVILGADSPAAARDAYLSNYSNDFHQEKDGKVVRGARSIVQMTHAEFNEWVRDPGRTVESARMAHRADGIGQDVTEASRPAAVATPEAAEPASPTPATPARPDSPTPAAAAAPAAPAAGAEPSPATKEPAVPADRAGGAASASAESAPPASEQTVKAEGPAEVRPLGKKAERGFGFERSAREAVEARGLNPDDYTIEKTPLNGYIAVRKAAKALEEGAASAQPAKAGEALPNATAPEHVTASRPGISVEELKEMAAGWRGEIDAGKDAGVTRVFDSPTKDEVVRLHEKVRVYHAEHGWMTPAAAKKVIQGWKDNAEAQGKRSVTNGNSNKVVLSLFDLTGKWSAPWREAGYQVWQFDIQDSGTFDYENPETGELEARKIGDVNNMSVEFFNDLFGDFEGADIHAVLAACPCTDFAVSGARHFAAKDADGRTVASVELVQQTLALIEYYKPAVWAIENPVGRIEALTGLPPWRLSFDPNHLGETYTKKTLIWGRFNADLPIAPVDPVEGSKMHSQYGGKSMATKNARSATPEGFAYAFFQANNAVDHPAQTLGWIYDRLPRALFDDAVAAGLSRADVANAIDDAYYIELDDEAAEAALREAIAAKRGTTDHKPTAGDKADGQPTKQSKSEKAAAKAEQAETERATYRALLADPDMVGKSVEDLAAAMIERAGVSQAAATKAAEALHKAIAKRAAELEKEKNRDPKVLLTQITERAAAAGLAEGQAFADFNAGFGHAMAGKTKSTLAGEGLADMLVGYKEAKDWLKTEEGRAYFEGRPARKLENTGADLRRWMDQLKREAQDAKDDGTKLWEAIKKATVRATLFPITPPDGATPGVTRLLEYAREELTGIFDFMYRQYETFDFDTGYFLNHAGDSRPGLDSRVRTKYSGTRDQRMAKFLTSLLSERYAYRRDTDAPQDQWTAGDRWDRDRKKAPLVRATVDERHDVIMGWVEDYIAGVRRWHKALSKAMTAQEGVDIAAKLIEENKEQYRDLYQGRLGGKPREIENPMMPRKEEKDLEDTYAARAENRNKSWKLQNIVGNDATPLAANGDRTKPLTWPRLDSIERSGLADVRGASDVTPADAKAKLGFADIGFGTWVNARTDQDHLNYAYDAFMDLAKFMGLPSKMIGFDGTLHFTIGALGHGRHAAHFQKQQPHPNGGTVPVINVTNTKGDGTVAHEWAHALDLEGLGGEWPKIRAFVVDALRYKAPDAAKINEVVKMFLIGGTYWVGQKNDKVGNAMQALEPRYFKKYYIEDTAYNHQAKLLDKGKKDPYWSNDKELIARSFEAFVFDTLGGTNTYLVNPWVADGHVTAAKGYRGTPYPTGAERQQMNKLWAAVRASISVQDGKLVASEAKFKEALGDWLGEGEERRQFLLQPKNMQAYYYELIDEIEARRAESQRQKIEKARKEQEEADAAAAEALASLEAMSAPPAPSETTGQLTEDDLEAIFDEAAAELREDIQETPDVPPPGEPMRELEAAAEAPTQPQGKREQIAKRLDLILTGPGRPISDKPEVAGALDDIAKARDALRADESESVIAAMLDRASQRLMRSHPQHSEALDSIGDQLAAQRAPAIDDKQAKTAAKIAAEAAKLGVEGLGEAMQGLVKLFGGRPGQLNSFPAGFDKDTYEAAKPHFQTALAKFQEAGKTLKDLFKFLIQQFGDGVKMYAVQFAKDEGLSAQLGAQPDASMQVAGWVQEQLRKGAAIDWRALFERADTAFGGTQAEGKYTPKDAYDALEAGINGYIMANPLTFSPQNGVEGGTYAVAALTELLAKLPTQSKRTAETDAFQQFSTIPPLAYVANWVANVSNADTVLEPSAGIGGLAAFAHNAGAKLILNELSSRRAAVLQQVFPASRVFHENAEQLDNILPADVIPSVVVMNPPFSASASRGASKDTSIGAQHVEQALDRLVDGGRLVAIVGDGMRHDATAFKKWWARIGKAHSVRAVVPMSGKGYAKYGTTFDNVLLVIDKVAPGKDSKPLTTPVESYNQLLGLLAEIRNDRPTASVPAADRGQVERDAALAERSAAAQQERNPAEQGGADVPGTDGVGGREPLPGQGAGRGRAGAGGASSAAGSRSRVRQPDNAGDGNGADADGSGGADAGATVGSDRRPEPAASSGVAVEAADAAPSGELTESIFEGYQPQRLKVEGAKAHPGPLVQSAAMASVLPPAPTYTPNLPKATIEKGLLSIAQIEAVVYAGQAHSQTLPGGERRGFFIGDGTGVGKGREISGIVLDNLRQGRDKAVWVSEKPDLMKDAQRDFKGVGGDDKLIFAQSKVKATAAIPGKGVLFTTYATLRSGAKGQDKGDAASKGASKSRIDQLVEWLGPDFDGVIAFDEAHNAGNAVAVKGKRGNTKPSEQALAVVDLQKKLPNARVVYVSATGATEVSNLSYATRLGLWGEGTPFASVSTFINQMTAGGLANMELVARDMKQMGMYLARSLSFDGVTYSRLEHQLTPIQRDIYDRLCDAWQVVLQNFDAALEATGALDPDTGKATNPKAVSAARSAFWGGQQRFFNQVITSMQMPAVLEQMEQDVAAGKALVLQLVNTNEAAQERALAKKKEEGEEDLEDLDLTPRDQLLQMVEKSFPVVQMEEYQDEEGKKQVRAVTDSEGKPVLNKKAVAMRDELLEDLKNIKVPDGPLELILNHFGADAVAEVTGRSRRVVRVKDAQGNLNPVIQSRGAAAARNDAAAFMEDKKRILIFSDAGGTGFSFHADRTQKNQRKRAHYLIQPGWRADKAVQGFGRTHRTNQASAPHYYLAATDIPAHKRFLSSIARRLDQLGALTKGQRDTANQGLFNEKDNLESLYATQAIKQLVEDGIAGRFPGFMAMLEQMGLSGIIDADTGAVAEGKMPPVSKFLNRMLSLKLDTQTEVFDAFITRMEQKIETAIERGEFDAGLQTIKALSTEVVQDEVIYTDPRTKAETHFVELKLTVPNKFWEFPTASKFQDPEWIVNKTSGKVYLRVYSGDETLPSGAIAPRYQLRGTSGTQTKKKAELYSRTDDLVGYEVVTEAKARELWDAENLARPQTVTRPTFLITGAVLPIWDRLDTGTSKIEVVRTQTADGKRLLGRQVMPGDAKDIRKRFDLTSAAAKMAPLDVMKAVLQGKVGELSNGWRLQRAKVSDDMRIELKTTGYVNGQLYIELEKMGVIRERINWADRLFVPVGADGVGVLEKLFATRPLVDFEADGEVDSTTVREDAATYGDTRPLPPGAERARVESPQGAAAGGRSADVSVAIFAAPGTGVAQAAEAVKPRVKNVETGRFNTGIKQVNSWQDAAHIVAPLRKSPQERMIALVLDERNLPLAVIQHSVGQVSAAEVEPWSLLGAIAAVPRAKRVYFAHNHPSGSVSQSNADKMLTSRLDAMLRDSGIKSMGMIVVSPGSTKASFFDGNASMAEATGKVPAARRDSSVPVLERVIRNVGAPGRDIGDPSVAASLYMELVPKHGPGVLLVNARHQVVGYLPVRSAEMVKLRTGDTSTGTARILRSLHEANAAASIVFAEYEEAGDNIAKLLSVADVRPLDVFTPPPSRGAQPQSRQARGLMPRHSDGLGFRSVRDPAAGEGQGVRAQELRRAISDILRTWSAAAPQVRVVDTAHDLPPVVRSEKGWEDVEGWYDDKGTVYLVAGNLTSAERARRVLAHEAVGHFGIEAIVGENEWGQIRDTVYRMMKSGAHPELFAELHRRYRGVNEALFVREAVAVMAEKNMGRGLVVRLVAAMRRFLRGLGFDLEFSEHELRDLIAKAARYVRNGRRPRTAPALAAAPAFSRKADTFYSALVESVARAQGAPKKGTAEQWRGWLDGAQRRGEFKQAERDWMGVDAWLDTQETVTREELAAFVRAHEVQLEETVLGDAAEIQSQEKLEQAAIAAAGRLEADGFEIDFDDYFGAEIIGPDGEEVGPFTRLTAQQDADVQLLRAAAGEERPDGGTQYGSFTLPGGENYRELLLTLPLDKPAGETRITFKTEDQVDDFLVDMSAGGYEDLDYGREDDDPLSVVFDSHLPADMADRARRMGATFHGPGADAARESNAFSTSHFNSRPNILAHVRFNERTDADGKKVLFIEEIQSDWHQAGRKRGYKSPKQSHMLVVQKIGAGWEVYNEGQERTAQDEDGNDAIFASRAEAEAMREQLMRDPYERASAVPDAPFKGTDEWAMLAFKRIVRRAVDGGFDRIAWTTGDQQAARYDLSRHISEVFARNNGDETFAVTIIGIKGDTINDDDGMTQSQLEAFVGKELTDKIIAQPEGKGVTYAGLDLKVGGDGMRGFYDKVLPLSVNKWAKKFGAKVGVVQIDNSPRGGRLVMADDGSVSRDPTDRVLLDQHGLDLTPAMREAALAGQPLFSRAAAQAEAEELELDTAFVAGLSATERKSPALAAFAQGLWRTMGTDSPFFRMWFGDSKVVDAKGWPRPVYHGTADDFAAFDAARLGGATQHMSTALGFFFAEDKAKADRYADKAADGVPADARTLEVYLAIANPKAMTTEELLALESADEARALRTRLQREGFDGIHLTDIGQWIAFKPEQIKRTDNRGTFDAADSRMKFSRPDPATVLKGMDAKALPDSVFEKLRNWWSNRPISAAVENARPTWLGALTLRHLAELGKDIKLGHVAAYADRVQQMATDRNAMQEAGAQVSDTWEKFQKADRVGADATANLMHDTTIAAVDPSRAYVPLTTGTTKRGGNEAVTPESIARRIAAVDADIEGSDSNDVRRVLLAERKALEDLLAEERARLRAYPELVRRYQALPEKGREVYAAARKVYDDQSKALRDAIIARIKDSVADGDSREKFVMEIRHTFESARVRGPYFPLARFGEFWINAEKDGEPAFFMYETVQDWREGQNDLAKRGYVVKEAGRKIAEARSVAGVSSGFMADLEGVLKQAGTSPQILDDVWQMYLRTLPELSMRKHFIHRKKVEGYSGDALRAFSGNVFHGSYQIARVRHSHKLEEELSEIKKATAAIAGDDPERAAKAAALTTELNLRHEWVMNPKDSKTASRLTSLGFVWYLGMTPAAAAVNLTQTAIVTFPVLASRFGVAKAWNTLSAAMGRAIRNVDGNLTRGLSEDEREAFKLWEKSGAIDRTMAHNLAGLSETDTRGYNPVARRGMELVSLMFHKAEVVNREATALAAFRLAKDAGKPFHEAVQYAAEVITETHFDYTNANRARWMQSNVAKVLLLFRQYSLNMTWFLWRNFYLSTKGESPAVKKEARKKLAGVLGMTGLFAGVMGLPLTGLMMDLANAAAAAFGDDDEPFDAEVEFRNFLADLLGPDLARVLTNGPLEAATGIEFGSRVGLGELWLRTPDRELEGQAMADYLLEQAAGPVVGGMLVNTMRGGNMIAEGNTWRGIETMAPKAVKDAMKSIRYAKDGVNTMRGDPIIEDLNLGETLMQLAGFSPAAVTEQYDANSAAKNYEQRILNRRRALLNAYAMAWRNEDPEGITKALGKIQAWNEKHPRLGITVDTIRRSLANRMRFSAKAESGVVLDRRIADEAREEARFSE